MSHEIRTPLNAILGLSEVELQNRLPDPTRENLEKIYHSGSHLLEIVNDILDISKIETGNFEIFPGEYDFATLISDTVQLNIVRIGLKQIEFRLELQEDIPVRLYGDELRIKQILNNLLSNAFKYTEEGTVKLVIGWERQQERGWFTFRVEDTGRGIKREDIRKLFSEYTQLEAASNRRIEGTGLGLSITRGLVEMMGGSIRVDSRYGVGSVFQVRLPQGIAGEKPIGRETAQKLKNFRFSGERGRSRGSSLMRAYMPYGRVLVVDDLATNLDVMKGLLMPYGLQVDTVLSGREAVEAVGRGEVRYDVVFMDHMMPEMDGIEATRIIRNELGSEYAREVAIIALTANAVSGNREMFLEKGFTDFISKPIDIKRLDMVLNQWIRDRQSAATLREAEELGRESGRKGGGETDEAGRWLLERKVEGVDFEAALRLYGSSGESYLAIVKSFVQHTPGLLERMEADVQRSLEDYGIEVHGLKGTCKAVCAAEAGAVAQELEAAAKEGREEEVRGRHEELKRQVLELTGRLGALVGEWEAGREKEEKESRGEPERELLRRLSDAAGEYNSSVTEQILGELERYRYERSGDLIEWLREQAENFDYEAMHSRLEEVLGNEGRGKE
jgi:CheY-like chemotaxis protein/anti-sigma regulatory factor (Ser/Thr protein kinase)